jgi:hypothetical protein
VRVRAVVIATVTVTVAVTVTVTVTVRRVHAAPLRRVDAGPRSLRRRVAHRF